LRIINRVSLIVFVALTATGGGYAYSMLHNKQLLESWTAPTDDVHARLERLAKLRVDDPLSPGRFAIARELPDPAFAGISAKSVASTDWVRERPDAAFRHERSAKERGLDPCAMPKTKDSELCPWIPVGSGRFSMPKDGSAIRADGSFDLVIHLHGHDVAREVFAKAKVPMVFFGASFRDYRGKLAGAHGLEHLVQAAEKGVSKEIEREAKARHIALAAWSGGYDGISVLLEQATPDPRLDAVILLDGLHGSRIPAKLEAQMGPFVAFAKRAAKDEVFFFMSHSSVDTDYASTTETMRFVTHALGGRPLPVRREDPHGMQLIEMFDQKGFHMRGYAGGGKLDHCAALLLYPDVVRALAKRWNGS
jgi:hypothetical protein